MFRFRLCILCGYFIAMRPHTLYYTITTANDNLRFTFWTSSPSPPLPLFYLQRLPSTTHSQFIHRFENIEPLICHTTETHSWECIARWVCTAYTAHSIGYSIRSGGGIVSSIWLIFGGSCNYFQLIPDNSIQQRKIAKFFKYFPAQITSSPCVSCQMCVGQNTCFHWQFKSDILP